MYSVEKNVKDWQRNVEILNDCVDQTAKIKLPDNTVIKGALICFWESFK